MERDGCDIVGMTGMPEASLARELGLGYACCALSVNWAAGKTDSEITMDDIRQVIGTGMMSVKTLLVKLLSTY
jgi:5'-methylthioinosine phosphorylase